MAVEEKPGITLKELCENLHIAPSTGTRFVDKVIVKGIVESKTEGKLALMFLTRKELTQLLDIESGKIEVIS